MTEITIGRDAKTGQLKLRCGDIAKLIGGKDSVPHSVSREHARLCCNDENDMVVENLNIENDTFVNGVGIERKRLKMGDQITLGTDGYTLKWDDLKPLIPVDISGLETVWEDYDSRRMAMQIRQGRFNALRMVLFGLTAVVGIAAKQMGFSDSVTIISALLPAAFAVYSWIQSGAVPKMQKALMDEAQDKYRCPRCRHLFPLQQYKLFSQMKKCPDCGAIFKR